MVSPRKIAANRRNSRRSTGPRTSEGKTRSKQNSWRHGLTAVANSGAQQSTEIRQLANAIAGTNADQIRFQFAVLAAEAEIKLLRVQSVQNSLLALTLRNITTGSESHEAANALAAVLGNLNRLERYEHRAFVRRNRLFGLL